jgi:hypothetical protein
MSPVTGFNNINKFNYIWSACHCSSTLHTVQMAGATLCHRALLTVFQVIIPMNPNCSIPSMLYNDPSIIRPFSRFLWALSITVDDDYRERTQHFLLLPILF